MGKWLRFYFVGPESSVYHLHRECPRLTNRARYYPTQSESLRSQRGQRIFARRRLCGTCAKWKVRQL